jgi:hypothetical protein
MEPVDCCTCLEGWVYLQSTYVLCLLYDLDIQHILGMYVEHCSQTWAGQQSVTILWHWQLFIWSHFVGLLRWVCWTSKSDLSSTANCDQNHISDIRKIWSHLKFELSMSNCSANWSVVFWTEEQKFILSCSFMCGQNYNSECYEFGHTVHYVQLKCSTNPSVFNNFLSVN